MEFEIERGDIVGFAETFKALSDPIRREILVMLKEGKMSAGEIAEQFDMTAATISYHLSQLKKAGLLIETKYKNFIYYEINISVLEEVMLWFTLFEGVENEDKSWQINDYYYNYLLASHNFIFNNVR